MKLLRYIQFAAIVLSISVSSIAASVTDKNADKILKSTIAEFKSAPALDMSFTIHTPGVKPTRGDLLMSRRNFRLTTPGITVWFDGTVQYTYVASDNEVSVTEPTAEELATTNPFELITSGAHQYDCSLVASSSATATLALKPKAGSSSSGISNMLLTVDRATHWPRSLVVTFESGSTTTFTVDGVAVISSAPKASEFQFDKGQYPQTSINDLR